MLASATQEEVLFSVRPELFVAMLVSGGEMFSWVNVPFLEPVEAVGPLVDYHDKIKHPMDLKTLDRKPNAASLVEAHHTLMGTG